MARRYLVAFFIIGMLLAALPRPPLVQGQPARPTGGTMAGQGATDLGAWTPLPTAGVPSPRNGHTAVWTGSEMIVWGGGDADGVRNDGARYNPASQTWAPLALAGAPSARSSHTAVWTGRVMLVWGGAGSGVALGDGAAYTPTGVSTSGGTGFRLESGSRAMRWDGGREQTGYLVLRYSQADPQGFTFLPAPDQPLRPSATHYTDPSPPANQEACYTLLVLGNAPKTPLAVLGMVDVLCAVRIPGVGAGLGQFAIQLNQSSQAQLSWAEPGGQDRYELLAFTFDGTPNRTTRLAGTATSTVDETGGKLTCYALFAFAGEQYVGTAHVLCAFPGSASLGTAGVQPPEASGAAERLQQAARGTLGR